MVAIALLGIPAVATGLIGFAHTAAGRPLLAMMAGGGCPVPPGSRRATPEQREELRTRALVSEAGTTPAAAKPALGFELGGTTMADAQAWAARHEVSCKEDAARGAMRCLSVPARAVGEDGSSKAIDDLWLSFDPDGLLVGVDGFRRGMDAATADEALHARAREVAHATGSRAATTGEQPTDGKLGQRAVRFRFTNYAADLSITTMPWSSVLLRERYSSI